MDVYQELYYHFVWATKGRMRLINEQMEAELFPYILTKCKALDAHALNGMPDHVHLVCSLPTKLAIADFVNQIKGSSAHFVNHLPSVQADISLCLYWQNGYGAMTLTKRDLPRLIAYVQNQKAHHADHQLLEILERLSSPPSDGLSALNRPAIHGRDHHGRN